VHAIWPVTRLGYRVPRIEFDGVVHAVFARACYFECGDALLTLGAATLADGPTTLLLGREVVVDLRRAFRRGETVRCRGGRVRSAGMTLDLRHADIWRVPDPRPTLDAGALAARVKLARMRLAQARRTRSSVLDRSGEVAIDALIRACRDLDAAGAIERAARFVGWGEGLTPAGDDFLVGLCAVLNALAGSNAGRHAFVERVRATLAMQRSRTTPIAAHCLALAAQGHFNADVLNAIDAIRAEPDAHAAERTLDEVMGAGATSGADALTGILAGFAAWSGLHVVEHPA
jgi:Protein of unknown function (DUF2877)